jgi:hypothetical protein
MMASSSRASSVPAVAHVPVMVVGETSPCRARSVTSEFWPGPATYRSVSSITMKPLDNRPLPIAFGGPAAVTAAGTRHEQASRIAAPAVRRDPHGHQPVHCRTQPHDFRLLAKASCTS